MGHGDSKGQQASTSTMSLERGRRRSSVRPESAGVGRRQSKLKTIPSQRPLSAKPRCELFISEFFYFTSVIGEDDQDDPLGKNF